MFLVCFLCNRNEDIRESKLLADVGKRLKDIQDAQRINRNYMSKNKHERKVIPHLQTTYTDKRLSSDRPVVQQRQRKHFEPTEVF